MHRTCTAAEPGASAPSLRLNQNQTYNSLAGTGTYSVSVKYEYDWAGTVHFLTGPLAKASATYKEDKTGERRITAERESTRRFAGGLTNISESSTQFVCLGQGPARPFAAYGPDPAPTPTL